MDSSGGGHWRPTVSIVCDGRRRWSTTYCLRCRGARIELEDARADELRARAWAGQGSPRHLLRLHDIFGDLSHDKDFCADVEDLTRLLDMRGVAGAIAAVLDGAATHGSQGPRRSSGYA